MNRNSMEAFHSFSNWSSTTIEEHHLIKKMVFFLLLVAIYRQIIMSNGKNNTLNWKKYKKRFKIIICIGKQSESMMVVCYGVQQKSCNFYRGKSEFLLITLTFGFLRNLKRIFRLNFTSKLYYQT